MFIFIQYFVYIQYIQNVCVQNSKAVLPGFLNFNCNDTDLMLELVLSGHFTT
jgi:hypothetical protein